MSTVSWAKTGGHHPVTISWISPPHILRPSGASGSPLSAHSQWPPRAPLSETACYCSVPRRSLPPTFATGTFLWRKTLPSRGDYVEHWPGHHGFDSNSLVWAKMNPLYPFTSYKWNDMSINSGGGLDEDFPL